MGGTSTSQQTQSSTTAPWQEAQPALSGLLSNLSGQINGAGITPASSNAINTIEANAAQPNPYAGQIGDNATYLLNGGGALNQSAGVENAYSQYNQQMQPLASNTDYNPMNTPGIGTQLQGLQNSIMTNINGQAAAAGRDGSPANSQAAAYGVAQGLAPILTGQYNQNVQNQQGAANNLYNAGNTTGGLLSGMQQQYLGNQQAGAGMAGTALDAQNYGANSTLAAEAQRMGIPLQQLGLLANIGVPIAQTGSQSTGQQQGSQTMSGAQQFATIASGVGNLTKMFSPIKLFGGS